MVALRDRSSLKAVNRQLPPEEPVEKKKKKTTNNSNNDNKKVASKSKAKKTVQKPSNNKKKKWCADYADRELVELNLNDVMLGRGSQTVSFPGNIQYRYVVYNHKEEYLGSDKSDKAAVAQKVMDVIGAMDPPGRFVELLDGLDEDGEDCYALADPRRAYHKVCQSLREMKVGCPKEYTEDAEEEEAGTGADAPKTKTKSKPKAKPKPKGKKKKELKEQKEEEEEEEVDSGEDDELEASSGSSKRPVKKSQTKKATKTTKKATKTAKGKTTKGKVSKKRSDVGDDVAPSEANDDDDDCRLQHLKNGKKAKMVHYPTATEEKEEASAAKLRAAAFDDNRPMTRSVTAHIDPHDIATMSEDAKKSLFGVAPATVECSPAEEKEEEGPTSAAAADPPVRWEGFEEAMALFPPSLNESMSLSFLTGAPVVPAKMAKKADSDAAKKKKDSTAASPHPFGMLWIDDPQTALAAEHNLRAMIDINAPANSGHAHSSAPRLVDLDDGIPEPPAFEYATSLGANHTLSEVMEEGFLQFEKEVFEGAGSAEDGYFANDKDLASFEDDGGVDDMIAVQHQQHQEPPQTPVKLAPVKLLKADDFLKPPPVAWMLSNNKNDEPSSCAEPCSKTEDRGSPRSVFDAAFYAIGDSYPVGIERDGSGGAYGKLRPRYNGFYSSPSENNGSWDEPASSPPAKRALQF